MGCCIALLELCNGQQHKSDIQEEEQREECQCRLEGAYHKDKCEYKPPMQCILARVSQYACEGHLPNKVEAECGMELIRVSVRSGDAKGLRLDNRVTDPETSIR